MLDALKTQMMVSMEEWLAKIAKDGEV